MPRGVPRNPRTPRHNRPTAPGQSSVAASSMDDTGADYVTPAYEEAPQVPVELTPEQRRIQELENQLALERGRKDPDPELESVTNPGSNENIVIHFLEDGLTALSQVWYRGQELEFEPNSKAYKDTCNRYGKSWLDLRNDEFAQVARYGKIMFRSGPWPGKRYTDAAKERFESVLDENGKPVKAPDVSLLKRAEAAEARRKRAAPRLPQI